jgi:hypothetical protein
VKRLSLVCAATIVLILAASAGALLTPGRQVATPATVTALSVTGHSVVYSVGRTRTRCGSVALWNTATRARWIFGSRTIVGCEEGPSGGFGIPSVATTGARAFWLTGIGGNITDWQLWTATPTRPAARRLAFASSDTDGPPAIVLGPGTSEGVPYAVGSSLTYVAATGARLFRVELDSAVRLVAAGRGPGRARVVTVLADGTLLVLSGTGETLRKASYEPDEVVAVALAGTGQVVQTGRDVSVCCRPTGPFVTTLPSGATMLDYRERTIVYRRGVQVRSRKVPSEAEALARVIPVKPWQSMPFATDTAGSAWASGRTVSFRSGPLP